MDEMQKYECKYNGQGNANTILVFLTGQKNLPHFAIQPLLIPLKNITYDIT